jgi:hypothetical protein
VGTAVVTRLLNPRTGEMECKVCEARPLANLQPECSCGAVGERHYRYDLGSWQCRYGCKLEQRKGGLTGRVLKCE